MKRCLGLLSLFAVLSSGCDGPEHAACGDPERNGVAVEDVPEMVERAWGFDGGGSASFDTPGSHALHLNVEEVESVEVWEEDGCNEQRAGHMAEVLLSVEVDDLLSVRLPARVWMSEEAEDEIAVRDGEVVPFDSSMRVPYEPPPSWSITGVLAGGGCTGAVSVQVRITEDSCTNIESCPDDTMFVRVARLDLDAPWCDQLL